LGGLSWFFAGIGIGMAYGALLWRAATALRPGDESRSLVLTCAGALLRCLAAASLLTVAIRQAYGLGLWVLAGYFVSRMVWLLWIELRMTNARRSRWEQE